MNDPIGSFETIKDNFVRYIKTAFKTSFISLEEERESLLNSDKVLYRQPWIEPLPQYASSGKKIENLTQEDLPGLTEQERTLFQGLVSHGLIKGYELYAHQVEMLTQTLSGKHCIITSGTGSGKTESFLMPLLAQISRELATWTSSNPKGPITDNWWNQHLSPQQIVDIQNGFTLSESVQQRAHDTRPKAVRAMILYPMNALVEDQMTRLRTALDSDDVREWYRRNKLSNMIFFGRYNGATPVAGKLNRAKENGSPEINAQKVEALVRELQIAHRNQSNVEEYIRQERQKNHEVDDTELRSFFQRLDGAEMRCRFDMQLAPPDIMITNFSMLSIMLMREVDNPIFDKTRAWLECEDLPEPQRDSERPNRVFHLVIDELHLYRGTQGTEISYLLKLLLKRLGLNASHQQIRILASSASMDPGDTRSYQYISDFFGLTGVDDVNKKFKIIQGQHLFLNPLAPDEGTLPADPFVEICKAYDASGGDTASSGFTTALIAAGNGLSQAFGLEAPIQTIEGFLSSITHPKLKFRERLLTACCDTATNKNIPRPVCTFRTPGDGISPTLPYFFDSIFGPTAENLNLAARGLLIARALFDQKCFKHLMPEGQSALPRFRFHYFFRNIEGLWSATYPKESDDARTAGKLYHTPQIRSEEGHRVLELLYCDNCGTTFFGGRRGIPGDGSAYCELLPLSPNIEGIPEKNPAKIVEKRTYQEYAIFWPQGSQEFIPHDRQRGDWLHPRDAWWRQSPMEGVTAIDYTAQWVESYLNIFSGDVSPHSIEIDEKPENWVKGYFFRIQQDSDGTDVADFAVTSNRDSSGNLIDTHKALPCTCPACGVNEQYRLKASSIRAFRTGFAKTTQLFAKELSYQLPDIKNQRKLVIFSDSREDAAQISNGIERNHYDDLLREMTVRELHSNLLVKFKIVESFENGEDTSHYLGNFQSPFYEVQELWEDMQIPPEDPNPRKRLRRTDALEKVRRIKNKIVRVRDLIHLTNTNECAPIIKQFLTLGVNPAGPSIYLQHVPQTDTPWYAMFDFTNYQWTNDNREFQQELSNSTLTQLGKLFFGNLFYSLESSGLGYLTVDPGAETLWHDAASIGLNRDTFLETICSGIRILGHKYKYTPNDFDNPTLLDTSDYATFPSLFRKYIKAVANKNNIIERDLGAAVINTLIRLDALRNNGINIENLFIKVSSAESPVWISPQGGRPHLHKSAGVCTQHPETARLTQESQTVCLQLWKDNYLSYHSAIKLRNPIRLHCEELTGQTDDQFERQRHFRNIILLGEGEPRVKTIDVLSVTTTLEVGVDIGALQAIMLANMPPQRFNYQQRVGRAGRRGQAFSAILTFCRGRSHDEFYFNNVEKIINDPPPPPFLTMGQERIIKRLLAKEVLRQAFTPLRSEINEDLTYYSISERKPSVHGEFGKLDDWSKYREPIKNWITSNQNEIGIIIESLKPGIDQEQKHQLIAWVTEDQQFLSKVNQVLLNDEIATSDTSEKLAEGGVLPMFGMPTSVRNFYHEIVRTGEAYQLKSIDRNSDMAIYEFAPGSQKTKDKAIHTSIGFTSDYLIRNGQSQNPVIPNGSPFYNERWMVRCRQCNHISTQKERPENPVCPVCGETVTIDAFVIKSPLAYRSNLTAGKDSKDNTDIILSRPPILAESSDESTDEPAQTGANYTATIADRDVAWRINTNSDKLFEGKPTRTRNIFPFQPGRPFNLEEQWIIQGAEPVDKSGYKFEALPNGTPIEPIALAAHKNTEILRIQPRIIPWALTLDMFNQSGTLNYAGIRSGFYSAAFILQRVIADKLDVDPVEIEIADIRRVTSEHGENTAEIILTDELPNGSGFVRKLFTEIDQIITECIDPIAAKEASLPSNYLLSIQGENHQSCKDACYDCLKVFRNMNYHGLLDWRLGTALLRILTDPSYLAGADGKFNDIFELNGWQNDTGHLARNFAASFDFDVADSFGLPGVLVSKNRAYYVVVIHPFWNCHIDPNGSLHIPDNTWIAERIFEVYQASLKTGGTMKFIDTFNLHRRPGWCYQKLLNS